MIIALSAIGPLVLLTIYATLFWIFRNDNPESDVQLPTPKAAAGADHPVD